MKDGLFRRLARRDASGVNEPRDVAELGRLLDERAHRLARRDVYSDSGCFIPGIPKHVCRRPCVCLAPVGEYDAFAYADAARDCLADLTSSNHYDDNVRGAHHLPLLRLVHLREIVSNLGESGALAGSKPQSHEPNQHRHGGGIYLTTLHALIS